MKINKKFALQLTKEDFYYFKLCTVDKVHAVRPVDNNDDNVFLMTMLNRVSLHYDLRALCRCHFCRFAQLSRLLTGQLDVTINVAATA